MPDLYAWRPSGNGGDRRSFWRRAVASLRSSTITDLIIGVCLVMLIVETLFPIVASALLFYPPLVLIEPYRLVTSAFLHSGFWHFAFNMITLYLVGRQLERGIGRWRYALLYLLSAVAGNLGVLSWAALTSGWGTAVVGASGAVFGLFGALIAFAGKGSDNFRSLLVLVAVNAAYSFITPNISWQSHIAGFAGGLTLAWLWRLLWQRTTREHPILDALIAGVFAAALGGIMYLCVR